jgi:signal transduction histidine kinase
MYRCKRFLFCLFPFIALPLVSAAQQEYADSLEQRLKTVAGAERIRTLNELTYFYFQRDVDKSVYYGKEALKLARRQSDKQLLSNTLNDYSTPFLTSGDFHKVIELNNEALRLRLELGDSAGLIGTYAKLGNAYLELSQYDKATAAYTKALALAQKLKATVTELQILVNLGNVLEISGFLKESYSMQRNALRLAEQLEDVPTQVSVRTNLASVAMKLGKYREAEGYYKESIPLIRRMDHPELLANVYQGLGVLYRDMGQHEKGLDYYRKTLAIYKKVNSKLGIGIIAVNMGRVFSDLGQLDSAAVYYNLGLKNNLSTKSYKQIKDAFEGLADLENRRKNFEKAYAYMQLVSKYKDSVQLFQGNSAISEMYAKYQTAEKERELVQTKLAVSEKDRRIAESELKLSRQRLIGLLWAVAAVGLLIVGFFFFRSLYRKRKAALLEIEVTKKNEQLRRERELNEQKLSISRELHDNIGSQLTYMISSMDNLTYKINDDNPLRSGIAGLSDFGRGTMQELRSTIWAMNSEDGSVDLLFGKLEELRSKVPLTLQLDNRTEQSIPLKAVEMLNLYRIAQEALQNAIKYAGAAEFSVVCQQENEGVSLTFSDNGSGFDTLISGQGNGLRNMRHRCEQIGGTFGLTSEKERGTTISCTLRHLSY